MSEDDLTIVGKAPPEPLELERANDRGFDDVELYLERSHLEDVNETLEIVADARVDVVSVHTPHVPIDDPEWMVRADELSNALDAYLVVHSNRVIHMHIPELERLAFESEYGYENNPGISPRHVESVIIDQGHELVLDTAHLYMADEDYVSTIDRLLTEFGDRISVIHLCDSTLTRDGLEFGGGAMDMESVTRLVTEKFDGLLVLEVMPSAQEAAREFVSER
ncbi:Sugar phosphate isomerase/epimerase [Halopelagius inordinatus]|uniref:Sugar phosphate isomerase/epimerase n=1 Tax=Halopelagius inordinatus TaxID=553467 RepID=A0A1I2U8K2_9EURY|nr:TIM barrel protein [Halopelagius inordinatus]SFG73450.1 Sugar phosphate isomerase/epimerase [Halopelagius inordinatus]